LPSRNVSQGFKRKKNRFHRYLLNTTHRRFTKTFSRLQPLFLDSNLRFFLLSLFCGIRKDR